MVQESEGKANVSARIQADDRVLLEAIAEYLGVSLSSLVCDMLTDGARDFVAREGWEKILKKNEERAAEKRKAAVAAAHRRQERFRSVAVVVTAQRGDNN